MKIENVNKKYIFVGSVYIIVGLLDIVFNYIESDVIQIVSIVLMFSALVIMATIVLSSKKMDKHDEFVELINYRSGYLAFQIMSIIAPISLIILGILTFNKPITLSFYIAIGTINMIIGLIDIIKAITMNLMLHKGE